MKKFAKVIRILTISPLFALVLVLVLHFSNKAFLGYNFLIFLITLVLLPLLAYPIQDKFKIIKGVDKRTGERKLAIIFSVIGYVLGFGASLIFSSSSLDILDVYVGIFYLLIKHSFYYLFNLIYNL